MAVGLDVDFAEVGRTRLGNHFGGKGSLVRDPNSEQIASQMSSGEGILSGINLKPIEPQVFGGIKLSDRIDDLRSGERAWIQPGGDLHLIIAQAFAVDGVEEERRI